VKGKMVVMKNKLILIIVIIIIAILLATSYMMTINNNRNIGPPKNTIEVAVLESSGTTEVADGQLKENEEVLIFRFYIKNNGVKDYELDPTSIYLNTKGGKIFCSKITPLGKTLLTKTTIKAGSEKYSSLTFIVSGYSFDYDIYFDDGHENYVISSQEDRDKDMLSLQNN